MRHVHDALRWCGRPLVAVPEHRAHRYRRIIRDGPLTPEDQKVDPQRPARAPVLAEPGSATIEDFGRLDLRVGRILSAEPLDGARVPAYKLRLDFGPGGQRQSSAQLVRTYPDPSALVGRLVVAVVNFPPRRVAGFRSDVLVLGALASDGRIPLLSVDVGAEPGQRVG
jgi:tRNA-binding protein